MEEIYIVFVYAGDLYEMEAFGEEQGALDYASYLKEIYHKDAVVLRRVLNK